jgi:hypothetical protein
MIEGHDPLLGSFAHHPHESSAQIHVLDVDAHQLTEPQARGVEEFEDGPVAPTQRIATVRHLEEPRHLVFGQVRGQRLLTSRRDRQRRRIIVEDAFAPEITKKGA